jgi:hypothetical protein
MVFVSITRLHIKSPRHLLPFVWHNVLSSWQIINIPGFLKGKIFRDGYGAYWTITTWKNQSAMKSYRNTGAHRQAMQHIQTWCDEAAVVNWEQGDSSLPKTLEAHCRMVTEGHFTRLSHPCAAHLERKIPEPSSDDVQGLLLHPRKKAPRTELEQI